MAESYDTDKHDTDIKINMAESYEISSSSISSSINNNTQISQGDIDSKQLASVNNDKRNELNANLKLCWTGDLESLKLFIETNIDFNGIWKSPGDERKSYSNGDTTITWWRKQKKLQFSGKEASRIKQQCCDILMGKVSTDNNMLCTKDESDASRTAITSKTSLEIVLDDSVLPAFHKPQDQCPCSQTVIDLESIKLDIEILQSRTDALQSLVNVQESCISSGYNVDKVELLVQEFSEEKEKLKKIESDLTDVKRMVYEGKDKRHLKSIDKVQTSIDISLNNTNQPSLKSNEAGDVVLTPVPIIPYINEVSDIDRIHDVSNTPSHQDNDKTGPVMQQRMQIKSYRKRQSKAYTHYHLNEQLQSYKAKHREIYMNNYSRVFEVPPRNTQINRSHTPMKRISESDIYRRRNGAPFHRPNFQTQSQKLTGNRIRHKDRLAVQTKRTTKNGGRHGSNKPPFHRRPTNHAPVMYQSRHLNRTPPYQIHQLMKLPSYQPHPA